MQAASLVVLVATLVAIGATSLYVLIRLLAGPR